MPELLLAVGRATRPVSKLEWSASAHRHFQAPTSRSVSHANQVPHWAYCGTVIPQGLPDLGFSPIAGRGFTRRAMPVTRLSRIPASGLGHQDPHLARSREAHPSGPSLPSDEQVPRRGRAPHVPVGRRATAVPTNRRSWPCSWCPCWKESCGRSNQRSRPRRLTKDPRNGHPTSSTFLLGAFLQFNRGWPQVISKGNTRPSEAWAHRDARCGPSAPGRGRAPRPGRCPGVSLLQALHALAPPPLPTRRFIGQGP